MRYDAEGPVHRQMPRKQSHTDARDLPGGSSPAASLIIVVALLVALVYFGVARTSTPTLQSAPATATQAQTDHAHVQQ
jgi:hypothetical protein